MGKRAAVILFAGILLFLTVLAVQPAQNNQESNLVMQDKLKTYTEKICYDNFDNKSCYDNTIVECNGLKYEMPLQLTGYVIHDQVYIEECPKNPGKGSEKPSPFDWVKEEQIKIYNDRVVIYADSPQKRWFIDSNSMDPLIDEFSHTIEIKPKKISDVHVGDIVAYKAKDSGNVWVHRVVKIEEDAQGKYFILKADNNVFEDDAKVRFEQIEGIVIGIVY